MEMTGAQESNFSLVTENLGPQIPTIPHFYAIHYHDVVSY